MFNVRKFHRNLLFEIMIWKLSLSLREAGIVLEFEESEKIFVGEVTGCAESIESEPLSFFEFWIRN